MSCNGSDNSARDCQRCKFATNESAATDNYCLSDCEHEFEDEGCTGVPVMSSTLPPYTSDGGYMCVCASAQEYFVAVVSTQLCYHTGQSVESSETCLQMFTEA